MKVKEKDLNIGIGVSELDKTNYYSKRNLSIREEFSGETTDKEVNFPKGLGAEHPFNFEEVEKVYKKYGRITEAINKYADAIVTDFEIQLKNQNAQGIVDSFIHDTNFHTVIRTWVVEGLLKGNGFIELDLDNTKIRVMNANHMYVKRNKKGKVLEYNQFTKPFKTFSRDSKDLIPFKPNQMAHLPINKIPNDPYGLGIVWSNERIIQNIILLEQDAQTISERKAGSPYHVKVGQPGVQVSDATIDKVKSRLQYLNNVHNWVTGADVDIKAIEFKDLGKAIRECIEYFVKELVAGIGIPEVMFGSGQLNEGIAKIQEKTFKSRIKTYQNIIGSVIEEKIIRPLLRANNLDEVPEFVWELPDQESIDKKIELIKDLILNASPVMKAGYEIELSKLLELEELEKNLPTPEEARKQMDEDRKRMIDNENAQNNPQDETPNPEREKEEKQIKQPEVPGAKPSAKEINERVEKRGNEWCVISHKTGKSLGCYPTKGEAEARLGQIRRHKQSNEDMKLEEWVNLPIKEISGFNYTDYLISILNILRTDTFENLLAKTEADIKSGLLPKKEIEKLRLVLKDGFQSNKTIKEIENNIKNTVEVKDRIIDDKLVLSASARPNIIARTETVRLANKGLIDLYKTNGIEKVRWLAALSDRTCPICEELNGQVFEINNAEQPPAHSNCRCSLLSVVE